jgi:hypothetical protein
MSSLAASAAVKPATTICSGWIGGARAAAMSTAAMRCSARDLAVVADTGLGPPPQKPPEKMLSSPPSESPAAPGAAAAAAAAGAPGLGVGAGAATIELAALTMVCTGRRGVRCVHAASKESTIAAHVVWVLAEASPAWVCGMCFAAQLCRAPRCTTLTLPTRSAPSATVDTTPVAAICCQSRVYTSTGACGAAQRGASGTRA